MSCVHAAPSLASGASPGQRSARFSPPPFRAPHQTSQIQVGRWWSTESSAANLRAWTAPTGEKAPSLAPRESTARYKLVRMQHLHLQKRADCPHCGGIHAHGPPRRRGLCRRRVPSATGEDAASSRDLRRCKRLAAYLHARKKTAIVSIGTGLSALRRTYTPGTTFHNMVLVSLRLYCA